MISLSTFFFVVLLLFSSVSSDGDDGWLSEPIEDVQEANHQLQCQELINYSLNLNERKKNLSFSPPTNQDGFFESVSNYN